jgi:hypothetical protein
VAASRASDTQYAYYFSGWSPLIVPVVGPANYIATFKQSLQSYKITFLNWDLTTFMSLYFDYGKTPTLVSKPTRPSDATYQYDFTGWSPELVPVVGPATYTAQFKQVPLEVVTYEITDMSVRVFASSSGSVWVCTIGEVTNTGNVDLYLRSGTIDLKDDADKLLESCQYVSVYPQIISPGEKAYYQESTTVDGITAETTVNATLHTSAAKSVIAKTALPISDVSLKNVTFWGVGAIGMVTNNTANDSSSVYVVVVLYNQANHALGVLFDILTVKAGEQISFSASTIMLPPEVTAESVDHFQTYGYVRAYFNS